jgi:hypothetical protein
VTITQGTQPYANMNAISGSATNATPYRISLAETFPCGAPVNFTLTVNYTGGGSPQVINVALNTGNPPAIPTALDTTSPPPGAGYLAVTGTQTGRLTRNGVGSSCGIAKPAPGLNDSTVGRRFDAFTFTASATGCITATLTNPGLNLYFAAYNSAGYVPTNPNTNFLADPGTSSATSTFSFDVTAGQQFTIVVHEVNVGAGLGINYTLNLAGPVAGVCVAAPNNSRADFDGDGKSDFSVFRASDDNWYTFGSTSGVQITNFGLSADTPVPGDYDNDGKADIAIFRESVGQWVVLRSSDSTASFLTFGMPGDKPVAGDYDGDGKTDQAIYRPSSGLWAVFKSTDNTTLLASWGSSTDVPVPGDYDGDTKTDFAVFRPSTGDWLLFRSTAGVLIANWGVATDKLVPADYDGDNKDDLAVYRPSAGQWLIFKSSTNTMADIVTWGNATDVPVPGDYDGDGRDDVAVFRNGSWFVFQSTGGPLIATWGTTGDTPIPAKYIP